MSALEEVRKKRKLNENKVESNVDVLSGETNPEDDNITKLHFGNYFICIIKREFDSPLDLDEITKIQYENLFGEIITISSLLNRVGLLKADAEEQVSLTKVDLEVFESQKRSYYHKKITMSDDKVRITEQRLEDCLLQDPEVIAMRKKLIQTKKNLGIIESIYWAVKSKDDKLSVLLKPVTPEEFADGIIEGVVNLFVVKKSKHVL